ncbi:unnamed protein product, partial [Mesorhabditis spiculigera]
MSDADSLSVAKDPEIGLAVKDELADVLMYLVRLSSVLGIDLNEAVTLKLASNGQKYPVDKAKSSSKKHFKEATGKTVGRSEIRSWQGSLTYMAKVLRDEGLPSDAGLAIELHIPQSSKRIDFLLTGRDENQAKKAVLIELKQWSKASATTKDAIVKTALGGGLVETIHPSYQVWSYAALLEGFNEAVYDKSIEIRPCAYLHNYVSDGIIDSAHYEPHISKAPLFLKGPEELTKLRSFLKKHIAHGDNKEVLYELSDGKIRPSKALAEALEGLMTGKPDACGSKRSLGPGTKGSGAFIDTEPNTFDALIVDEAHRLNEKSGLYGNLGENQIKELVESAKCSIFFIDEDQRVTLSDIGSKQAIRAFAKAKGAVVEEYVLSSQFRCSGSDGYMAWLDDVLGIRSTANPTLNISEYEFKVFDSPQSLHNAIDEKNHGNKARVVAGYCWPWLSKKDSKATDIVIGNDYARQWNLDQDGSLWIIAENSIEQVGCIHTCQGLEVDYIGVIIGPDLVVRDGQVVTSPHERDKNDKSIRGWKKLMKEQPALAQQDTDLIIKNTYRTLMTRGMKGCYLYCTDQETAQYFESRLARPSNG